MSNTVIKVENLSKMYDLGQVGTGTLSKDLNRSWAKLRGKPDPYATLAELNDRTKVSKSNTVWALKDINFELQKGEVLGIIGKNGAGKSTLLKLLSQITSPTTGEIKMKGRVASLLEVGTGMHPEMTAKQNIYLNGAIMGMTRKEVSQKFNEIVVFAGIEKYIDTPIKRFSSGMKVRLGFAVAAFLEPEILIVDEVLAVGDAEFQNKAIGKMKDITNAGSRTVLFVSHNMSAVKSLCTTSLLIENGMIKAIGDTDEIIAMYMTGGNEVTNYKPHLNIANEKFKLIGIGAKSASKDYFDPIERNEEIEIIIHYENLTEDSFHFTFKFKGEDGNYFQTTSSTHYESIIKKGEHTVKMTFPGFYFNDGVVYVDLLIVANKKYSRITEPDIISFVVNPTSNAGGFLGKELGYVRGNFEWKEVQ